MGAKAHHRSRRSLFAAVGLSLLAACAGTPKRTFYFDAIDTEEKPVSCLVVIGDDWDGAATASQIVTNLSFKRSFKRSDNPRTPSKIETIHQEPRRPHTVKSRFGNVAASVRDIPSTLNRPSHLKLEIHDTCAHRDKSICVENASATMPASAITPSKTDLL